ncbi:MAG: DUF6443 domain-containing protein [Arcicella sp.]|jgi:RHS repeat-associated protein|nr:DUF6443 domain-containing protein [Arcicella sp.]
MKINLFSWLCLVFLSSSVRLFAQETPDPQEPKKQPLEQATPIKEAPKKENPTDPKDKPIPSVAGALPIGQSPTASPESKLINQFQDIPVNLYLGVPIINLPIYTLSEAGGASVPLTLSYNATGMRGQEVSGWCGMNWEMNLPQISRVVRGIPDEGKYTLNNDFSSTGRKGFYQYGLKADNSEENDSQPDLFLLVVNGQSYKFSFDVHKKAHFFPEADIEVNVTWQERFNVGDVVGIFTNWRVRMPDGSTYFFASTGVETESSFEMEAEEATNGSARYGTGDFTRYITAEKITSAWYLTKIETAFGHQTSFDYYPTQYSFFRLAEQEATTNNCTFNGIVKKINKVFIESNTLQKISNSTHVVEINRGGWSSYYDIDGELKWYLNNLYPARRDIDRSARYPSDSSNARALHKITVYAKDDPTKTYEWQFKYDYNFGNDASGIAPLGYSYATLGYSHQRRFKLRSIQEPSGNQYTFKYYDDGFVLPSRLTQGIDHWGYLNGVLGANLMIGEDAYRACSNGQYANRSATVGWSQYGTLTAISHSTGGSTLLSYENHTARNYSSLIGGSRIKKITFVDSISNLKTVKRYDYQQVNGQSSGFLCLKPVYHFDDKTNFTTPATQYWYSGLYQQLLSESGRPGVGYSRVKETILSNDESDSLGYTVSEFLQPLTEINLREKVYFCYEVPDFPSPKTVCDTFTYIRPWKWIPYHENTVGVPFRVSVYGKANQLLSQQSSVYEEQQLQVSAPDNYQQQYHPFRWAGKNYSFEQSFFQFYQTYRLVSDTTKVFSQQGTNPQISINSYQYATQAKHNQVIKTSTKDSYGNTIEQSFKYAPDFSFGFIPPLNQEGEGVKALKSKHIYTAPIEQITRKKNFFGTTFIVGASYQSYYGSDSVGRKAGMLKSSFSLENTPRSSMVEATYVADFLVKDGDYDLKTTNLSYTAIGLPTEIQTRFGTTSKVNYDATYPTLAISQISNVGEASEQSVSTQYGKILYGASQQTGANGLSVSSEYYPDGKLKQQTDKDGKVLKHLQYVYRGQADSDPLLSTNTAYNRVITRVPRIATTTPLSLTHVDCAISVVYMDGAGRVVEQVGYRASPNQKDMISGVVDYDKFSRVQKNWLSVESNKDDGSLLDTATAKSIAKQFYGDAMPYSEVLSYESSPMSRVFKAYGPGKAWRDNLRYSESSYETTDNIPRFRLFYDSNVAYTYSQYNTYEISKVSSTDERGSKVISYQDRSGNLIQKDVQVDDTNYLKSMMVYDEAGRLRYTLMPKAVAALPALGSSTIDFETWSAFEENVYAAHYDFRQRVFESHQPGQGWVRSVYNRLNQVAMTQNGDELARNNTWNYVQRDGQGRTVRLGQMQLPSVFTRDSLQKLFNAFVDEKQFEERSTASGQVRFYTNRSFPSVLRSYINETTWKQIDYYDDYNWRYDDVNSGTVADYGYQSNPYYATAYSVSNAKGLMTGRLEKIDNFGNFAFPMSVYYDDKNRSIQSITYQDLYARNQEDRAYNFVGELLESRMIYRKSGASDYTRVLEQTYDHVGRLQQTYYRLSEGTTAKVARMKLSSLLYDNIGRVKTKFVQPQANLTASKTSGNWNTPTIWQNNTLPSSSSYVVISQGDTVTIPLSTTVTAGTLYDAGVLRFLSNAKLQMSSLGNTGKPALQEINYTYNVRNQMRGINLNANGELQTSADKLFSYKLDYHEDGRYFDGSISKQTWKSSVDNQSRSYRFTYDRANRLSSAISGVGEDNFSIPRVSYDANGNISFLSRMAKVPNGGGFLTTKIDSLDYQYLNGGNKLRSVTDNAIRASLGGFKNGTNSGDDYEYYPDGKLKKDLNRNISLIQYNYLDLVSKIKFANNDSIQYFYSSGGQKRRTERVIGGQKSYTFYDGEMVYVSTSINSLNDYRLSEIQNPEGRYVNGKLEYSYTDHLGNLRLSYKDSLGVAFITQSYAYDAWGLELKLLRYQFSNTNNDRYTWQGKEDLEADNLEGWSDFGWRIEDRTLGRWFTPDPEDQFKSVSPFAYCANNPVSMVDPDGRFAFLPFLAATIFSGHIGGMISQGNGGSYGKGFLTGALGGAAGYFAPIGFLPGLGYGAGTGALVGGINSSINGGNFWDGALGGGITGGLLGGILGGIGALKRGGDFWTGKRPDQYFTVSEANRILKGNSEGTSVNKADYRKFVEKQFPKESSILKSSNGTKLPRGVTINGDGSFKTPVGDALGITHPSVWKGGQSARVFISDAAFSSEARLFLTVGHEYTHAQHILDGLNIAYNSRNTNVISMDDFGTYDWSGMTEHAAYQWTVDAAYKNGWNSLGKSFSNLMFEKGYGYDLTTDLFKSRVNTIFRR